MSKAKARKKPEPYFYDGPPLSKEEKEWLNIPKEEVRERINLAIKKIQKIPNLQKTILIRYNLPLKDRHPRMLISGFQTSGT